VVEAEGVGVDRLANIGDAVGAQDVKREGTDTGEDARPVADAAVVLAQDAVADVVIAVFDAPMRADSAAEIGGREADLASIVGDLLARPPQAGARVLAPGQPSDARRAGQERLPVGVKITGGLEELDMAVLLAAVADAIHGRVLIDGGSPCAEALDRLKQAGLVGLDADQQGVAGAGARGLGEGFFAHAAHRP
jgi:hypothetical protein